MRTAALALFPLLAACGSMEQEAFELSFDPGASTVLRADTNDGDIGITGEARGTVEVAGTSVGRGINSERAREALAGNRWGGAVEEGVVSVFGSASDRGEVSLELRAPHELSADVVAGGTVTLRDMDGAHVVTADRIVARGLIGDADLYAREAGLDVEIWPHASGQIRLQSHGGEVRVHLPYGPDYDLRVFGDPSYELTVDDLGFDFADLGVGSFAGQRGGGTVEVSIHVEGGPVTVTEAH